MKNNSVNEIFEKLQNSKRILILLHNGPDGDSLGSCTAMKYFLERDFGCEVKLISEDKLDDVLMSSPFSQEVEFERNIKDINLKKFDIVIALDYGVIDGFGLQNVKEDIKEACIINIDHHETNSYFGSLNYVNKKSASACSVLIELFKIKKVKFDEELSNRLLIGVCTDSSFFTNLNSVFAIKDAYFLINNGADYLKILKDVVNCVPLKIKKYYSYLVDNLQINENKKYGYSIISGDKIKELDLNLAEIRLGINHLKDIEGLDFIFTLSEMEDKIKGSFRSGGKVDVSLLAKKLGGGGHKVAAAFLLEKMSMKKAIEEVIKIL